MGVRPGGVAQWCRRPGRLLLAFGFLCVAQLFSPAHSHATEGDIFKAGVYYGALTYTEPYHAPTTDPTFGPFGAPVDINGATAEGGWRAEEQLPDDYQILAPEDGRVDQVAWNAAGTGNAIVWSNLAGTERLFMAHLASVTKIGPVKAGDPIALIGGTAGPGASWPPHLHISRQQDGAGAPLVLSGAPIVPLDVTPLPYLQHTVYRSNGPYLLSLSNPAAPVFMARGKSYTVSTTLKPRHRAGTYPVRIYRWRKVSGKWKSYGYVKAKASDHAAYTRCAASVRLTTNGQWRLRAYAIADEEHPARWSNGYDYVTVVTSVVTVPNVRGMWSDDASRRIRAAGLVPKVVWVHGGGIESISSINWGHVYRQSKSAGSSIPRGSIVRIYCGYEMS